LTSTIWRHWLARWSTKGVATKVASRVHQQVDRLAGANLGKPFADAVDASDIDDRSVRTGDMGAVQIPDDNASAALHQELSDRLSDAFGCSGDDGEFPAEIVGIGHLRSPCRVRDTESARRQLSA
jgi:hypothetical protein